MIGRLKEESYGELESTEGILGVMCNIFWKVEEYLQKLDLLNGDI